MKMKIKALASIICIIMIAVSVTACEKSGGVSDKAEEIIFTVMNELKDAKEIEVDIRSDMEMEAMGQEFLVKMEEKRFLFTNPLKMKMNMTMEMNGEKMETVTYMGEQEGNYYAYTKVMENWTKKQYGKEEVERQIATCGSNYADVFIENNAKFKILKDKEEGKGRIVLEGILPKDNMREILNGMGMDEKAGMDLFDFSEMTFSEDLKVKVYVDRKTVSLNKISIDLTDILNKMMEQMLKGTSDGNEGNGNVSQLQFDIRKYVLEMEYVKTEGVEDFTIPREALTAEISE